MENIKNLLNQIQTIAESYERVIEANGDNFNIFSILKMETDEVKTHSRFIAELLNPEGVHGFKDEFLGLFINEVSKFIKKEESKACLKNINTKKCSVEVECYVGRVNDTKTEGGSIDILIKDDANNVIMIENKIYAGEQPNQLLRYQNAFPNGQLLYLTLWGNDSEEGSLSSDKYTSISYQSNIINWLEECKKIAVDNPTLRETIKQYSNLIKKLTHQNMNNEMNDELVKLILNNDKSVKTLLNTCEGIKNEVIRKLNELCIYGKENENLYLEEIKKINPKYKLKFSGKVFRYEGYSVMRFDFFISENKSLEFEFNSHENLNLSFFINSHTPELSNIIKKELSEDSNIKYDYFSSIENITKDFEKRVIKVLIYINKTLDDECRTVTT